MGQGLKNKTCKTSIKQKSRSFDLLSRLQFDADLLVADLDRHQSLGLATDHRGRRESVLPAEPPDDRTLDVARALAALEDVAQDIPNPKLLIHRQLRQRSLGRRRNLTLNNRNTGHAFHRNLLKEKNDCHFAANAL